MSSADVIEKAHPADESDVMHMAIKRLAGHYRDRCIVGVICGWRDDNDGARVIAKIMMGIKVVTIVKRVVRSDRRRRSPIAMYVIAGRAAHKAAANPSRASRAKTAARGTLSRKQQDETQCER